MQTHEIMASAFVVFGSFLNARKQALCFVVWAAANIIFMFVDLAAESWARVFVNVFQTGMCVYGFCLWKRCDGGRGKTIEDT